VAKICLGPSSSHPTCRDQGDRRPALTGAGDAPPGGGGFTTKWITRIAHGAALAWRSFHAGRRQPPLVLRIGDAELLDADLDRLIGGARLNRPEWRPFSSAAAHISKPLARADKPGVDARAISRTTKGALVGA
jgi:hypothetical protein